MASRPPGLSNHDLEYSRTSASAHFARGRKFTSDELHLMLLALLEQRSSHGYELIKELQNYSGGFWTPSPGMVYPALTYIEELGFASVQIDSNKKSYQLLPAGQAHLQDNRQRTDELFATLVHMARKMKYLEGAMAAETSAIDEDGWLPVFVEARRALKRALLLKSAASPAEQKKIAAILTQATEQISAITAHSKQS
ncbi:MAG TPA: PadR family transcriptional regulator [Eoetvoesiella sp.]